MQPKPNPTMAVSVTPAAHLVRLRHSSLPGFRSPLHFHGCPKPAASGHFSLPMRMRVARFSTTPPDRAKNQIYSSVRRPDDFHTYQLLSSSSRTPLITFWTTSYCSTCRIVSPLLRSLIESGVGEDEGGVAFCPVEYDAPDIMSQGLGMTYMITSIPTLLSFDAPEAQVETKVQDARKLTDGQFLEDWIRNEARRHGNRGGGGGGGGPSEGVFGGLFSGWKK